MNEPTAHPLNPLPQKLAVLFTKAEDPALAGRVEAWMDRQSGGAYPRLHVWLDAEGDLERRRDLGTRAVEIIESEQLNQFDQ